MEKGLSPWNLNSTAIDVFLRKPFFSVFTVMCVFTGFFTQSPCLFCFQVPHPLTNSVPGGKCPVCLDCPRAPQEAPSPFHKPEAEGRFPDLCFTRVSIPIPQAIQRASTQQARKKYPLVTMNVVSEDKEGESGTQFWILSPACA